MSFPKNPRLMSDDELCGWARALIERQAPESSVLDYKAEINLEKTTERVELAKDVSSFANEFGGTLLYGVPQIEGDRGPVPKSFSECGISIPEGLAKRIEDILTDVIVPPLPELHIRSLALEKGQDKFLLMIYHPESWCKPHMVEGYKEARYYRRGNYQTILMKEREVEAAYLFRKVSMARAEEFFVTGNFRPYPKEGSFLRVIICPRFPLIQRQDMSEERFKNWLDSNPPNGRRGEWVPFLDGWVFRGYPSGNYHGKQYELRLFHNGGYCFDLDLDAVMHSKLKALKLKQIKGFFKDMILPYAGKAFEYLRITGPVSMQVNLHNVNGLNAVVFPSSNAIDPESKVEGETPLDKDKMEYREETSVSEILTNQDKVLKTLLDRLCSAFGIWYSDVSQHL